MSHPFFTSFSCELPGIGVVACPQLGSGLNVIYGHNEAGKSGIMEFLTWMLFAGSEDISELSAKKQEKIFGHLEGVSGAAHLSINNDSVEITQKYSQGETSIHLTSSRFSPRDISRSLTDSLSLTHYNNVFALTLDQLSHHESAKLITEDDFISLFFGAAITGSGVSPAALLTELQKQKDELFSPAGNARNKLINKTLKEIEECKAELSRLLLTQTDDASYEQNIGTHTTEIAGIDIERERLSSELAKLTHAQAHYENFLQYVQLHEKTFPAVDSDLIAHATDVTVLLRNCSALIKEGAEEEKKDIENQLSSLTHERENLERDLAETLDPRAIVGSISSPKFLSTLAVEEKTSSEHRSETKQRNDKVKLFTADIGTLTHEAGLRTEELAALTSSTAEPAFTSSRQWSWIGVILAAVGVIGTVIAISTHLTIAAIGSTALACLGAFSSRTRKIVAAPSEKADTTSLSRELDMTNKKIEDLSQQISDLLDEQKQSDDEREQDRHAYISAITAAGFPAECTPDVVSHYTRAYSEYTNHVNRINDLNERYISLTQRLDDFYAQVRTLSEFASPLWKEDTPSLSYVETWASELFDNIGVHKQTEKQILDHENILRALEKELVTQFDSIDNARTQYSAYNPDTAQQHIDELNETLSTLDDQRTEHDHEIVRLRHDWDEESTSTAISDATTRIQQLTDELAAHHQRYLYVSTALDAAQTAFDTFRQENQPEVWKKVSRMMETITRGEWTHVSIDETTTVKGVPSLRIAGRRAPHSIPITELSRGTREQLYLCARIALMETSPRGHHIPVLLDDIAVNSDADRVRSLAPVLRDLARERQVFYFTCHETTRDILRDVAGAHTVDIS